MVTGRSIARPSLVQKRSLVGSVLRRGSFSRPSCAANVKTGFATQPPSIQVAPISATTSPSQQEWILPPGLKIIIFYSVVVFRHQHRFNVSRHHTCPLLRVSWNFAIRTVPNDEPLTGRPFRLRLWRRSARLCRDPPCMDPSGMILTLLPSYMMTSC